jgi:hypothetical protein
LRRRAGSSGLVVELESAQEVEFPEAASYSLDGRRFRAEAGSERTLPAGRLALPAGTAVPIADGGSVERGSEWAEPVERSGPASPVFVYSLLLATFLGTMGLPHILVRFYTNPDGRAARRPARPGGLRPAAFPRVSPSTPNRQPAPAGPDCTMQSGCIKIRSGRQTVGRM